jgi:hypothetical protein
MSKKIIVFSIGALCLVVFVLLFKLRADGQMTFPKSPHGSFIQNPAITTDGSTRKISWIIPIKCARASYEARETGYVSGSKMFWGGIENATCVVEENGYHCQAALHPEMKGSDKRWTIQASAYECTDGNYYVSEAVISE